MANRDGREALQRAEGETLDIIAEVLTSKQWLELLRATLERAAHQGNRGLAQKLVGAGAEIGNALHEAVRGGHEDVVNDLLENGASVAAENTHGETSLHVAAWTGKPEMAQLLLLKGADRDAMTNNRCTPLYLTVCSGQMATALVLLDDDADVNLHCTSLQGSVVHMAALRGLLGFLRAAIEHGADVDATDNHQDTALHIAATQTRAETIDVLVEAGANIEARNQSGHTPLHHTTMNHSLEALLALMKHGADVNPQDSRQQTPLHFAAAACVAGEQGVADLVDCLLRSGADETIVNDQGKVAADVIGSLVEEDNSLADDVARVRELLAKAPGDRAWRRRGYVVLCRAHPNRVQLIPESRASGGVAGSTRSSTKLARAQARGCNDPVGVGAVNGRTSGDWAGVVARVLELQEEGIFRAIVGYL